MLDNCAAACACRAWRSTVATCDVPVLHLHAACASTADLWTAFLSSRSAICHLQLTADLDDHHEVQQHAVDAHSFLRSIPLACRSLSAGKSFAASIHKFTDQPALLKHLTLDCGSCFSLSPESNSLQTLPMLTHLTQLETLHLKAYSIKDEGTGKRLDVMASCLSKCPESLCHLTLEGGDIKHSGNTGYRRWLEVHLSATLAHMLMTSLRRLTNIELVHCMISAPHGLVDSFSGLTSLSLHHSNVHISGAPDLSRLTNLVQLDVSITQWGDDQHGFIYGISGSFVGWPSLKSLNTYQCYLFESLTLTDVPSLHELTCNWLNSGTRVPRIHFRGIFAGSNDFMAKLLDPIQSNNIVSVQLIVHMYRPGCTAADFAVAASQLLLGCASLQSLHVCSNGCQLDGSSTLVLLEGTGRRLSSIELQGFQCSPIDLSSSTSLTSISLSRMFFVGGWNLPSHAPYGGRIEVPTVPCNFLLSSSVQQLRFVGDAVSMFSSCAHNGVNTFDQLTNLTQFVFGLTSGKRGVRLHQMPTALRQLHLVQPRNHDIFAPWKPSITEPDCFIDHCDWQSLSACTNLERLTLPAGYELKGSLGRWVKTARCLHVIDYSGERLLRDPV